MHEALLTDDPGARMRRFRGAPTSLIDVALALDQMRNRHRCFSTLRCSNIVQHANLVGQNLIAFMLGSYSNYVFARQN